MSKNKLKTLESEMHVKVDKFPESPLICKEFGWALFEISRFVRMTVESYSAESKRFGANIRRKNLKLKETGSTASVYSAKSDTMAAVIIPNFYYLCQIAIWGALEEFLRDAIFITITENITNNKTKGKEIKKFNIPKEDLVGFVLERGRGNFEDLNKIYKNMLKIDLKENKKFVDLFNMRWKRNMVAHSGFLFGYNSLTKKKDKRESLEKEVYDISDDAGMEFINIEAGINEKDEKVPDSWYTYDPTETSSHKLEQDFCSMMELVWELGYFVSKNYLSKEKIKEKEFCNYFQNYQNYYY